MFFDPIYLPLTFLARTRIRRRRAIPKTFLSLYADDSDEPTTLYVDVSDAVPDTPPKSPFLSLYADDSDDGTSVIYADDSEDEPPIDIDNSEDEYIFSDIELTDELIAVLDQTNQTNSEEEYVVAELVQTDSEDEYVVSDIEMTDDLIAILDTTY
jgi:hypothetical protein